MDWLFSGTNKHKLVSKSTLCKNFSNASVCGSSLPTLQQELGELKHSLRLNTERIKESLLLGLGQQKCVGENINAPTAGQFQNPYPSLICSAEGKDSNDGPPCADNDRESNTSHPRIVPKFYHHMVHSSVIKIIIHHIHLNLFYFFHLNTSLTHSFSVLF